MTMHEFLMEWVVTHGWAEVTPRYKTVHQWQLVWAAHKAKYLDRYHRSTDYWYSLTPEGMRYITQHADDDV